MTKEQVDYESLVYQELSEEVTINDKERFIKDENIYLW